jgi:hypothetical protein
MPRTRPKIEGSGRKIGTPNKVTQDLRDAAQKYTPAALQVLQSIMCNPKNPAASRVAAAAELLNRGHGKAHQSQDLTVTETQPYVVHVPETMDDDEWRQFLEFKRGELPPEKAPLKIAAMLRDGPDWEQFKQSQAGNKLPQSNSTALPLADTLRTQRDKLKIQ